MLAAVAHGHYGLSTRGSFWRQSHLRPVGSVRRTPRIVLVSPRGGEFPLISPGAPHPFQDALGVSPPDPPKALSPQTRGPGTRGVFMSRP